MIFNCRKKAVKLSCAVFILLGIIAVFFALPCSLIADNSEGANNEQKTVSDNNSGNMVVLSEIKADGTGKNFLPIIITSVVVVGILIFAMWQTFKSKRIY
jgi:hypothetical protein